MKQKFGLPLALMFVFALTRWPGVLPWNFSAAYALAFCAGVYSRRLPWWLPLTTLAVTDMLLNVFCYGVAAVNPFMIPNYLAFGVLVWLGKKLTSRASWVKLVGGGILGAIIFYLITNTAAWLENPEYAKTIAGWIQALTVGTSGWPQTWEFFRNTLLSGGLFTALFAGAMKLSEGPEEEAEAEEEEAEPAEPPASEPAKA